MRKLNFKLEYFKKPYAVASGLLIALPALVFFILWAPWTISIFAGLVALVAVVAGTSYSVLVGAGKIKPFAAKWTYSNQFAGAMFAVLFAAYVAYKYFWLESGGCVAARVSECYAGVQLATVAFVPLGLFAILHSISSVVVACRDKRMARWLMPVAVATVILTIGASALAFYM
jgi:hypothetical protein